MKGRYREGDGIYRDPKALDQTYKLEAPEGGQLVERDIPLRRAMNALLLDAYIADCRRICDRWNRDLKRLDTEAGITLPDRKFNRSQGIYAGFHFSPDGVMMSEEEWEKHRGEWLPSPEDREYVKTCMVPVYEPGKFANWIAPPSRGVNEQPMDFEYVKFH